MILGVAIVLIAVILKQVKPEYSLICILVGGIILIFYIIQSISSVYDFFLEVVNKTGVDTNMFNAMLKIIGIGYLIEFCSGICIDSGHSSIANKIVLAGKLLIFTVSLPIIRSLLDMVLGLVNLWNITIIK